MTSPIPVVQRFGITAFYRLLARWSLGYFGAAYTAAFTVAIILRGVALRRDWVMAYNVIAPLIAVLAFSLLFTVVTWYRDEDTVTAAQLLIIMNLRGRCGILDHRGPRRHPLPGRPGARVGGTPAPALLRPHHAQ